MTSGGGISRELNLLLPDVVRCIVVAITHVVPLQDQLSQLELLDLLQLRFMVNLDKEKILVSYQKQWHPYRFD